MLGSKNERIIKVKQKRPRKNALVSKLSLWVTGFNSVGAALGNCAACISELSCWKSGKGSLTLDSHTSLVTSGLPHSVAEQAPLIPEEGLRQRSRECPVTQADPANMDKNSPLWPLWTHLRWVSVSHPTPFLSPLMH